MERDLNPAVVFFGFGYDPINDDYKVMRVLQFIGFDGKYLESEVMIYSVKTNEWTRFQKQTPPAICYHARSRMGTFVAGSLHWIMNPYLHKRMNDDDIIVAFDLVVEDFSQVAQPEYVGNLSSKNLGVLGGCLCVLAYCEDVSVDLWVMKEYKVKKSWTKLLSIALSDVTINWIVWPLAYSKKGGEVLFEKERRKLCWYDLGTKRCKCVKIQNIRNFFVADICHESLDSLNINQGTDKEKQKLVKGKKRDDFLSKVVSLFLLGMTKTGES